MNTRVFLVGAILGLIASLGHAAQPAAANQAQQGNKARAVGQGIGQVMREGEQLLNQLGQAAMAQNAMTQGAYGGEYNSLYGDVATTPIQGIDYGIAKIIRSVGDYNLLTSQALLNLSEVERREMENWKQFTTTYFEVRRLNRDYRALERGPRPSDAEIARINAGGRPRRLTPSELDTISGQIVWPIVLQAVEFAQYREEIGRLFAARASHGVLGLDEYLAADRVTLVMLDVLRQHIYDVPPADYMVARRFLESLGYEARFPAI
jgi:hypothetical protein